MQQHDSENSLGYLAEQYRQLHQDPNRYRGRLQPYFVTEIKELVRRHKAKTLLDYGSGKGEQYEVLHQHAAWGIKPKCYDPGYPPFASKPINSFDGVICTDVMEHIPPNHVRWSVRDVLTYARKFAFFCIFTEPAKATLPDGRNAHLTIQSDRWWLDVLSNTIYDLYPGIEVGRYTVNQHMLLSSHKIEVAVVFRTKATKHME